MIDSPDLILLHAPSVYDFRQKSILYGPVSDVVPSTQIFEMYPIGFMTLLAHLRQHGYAVRIINVALRMLWSRRFDAEKLIRGLQPMAFGLDLHWLVHAHGSLALAEIIKKYHPAIPVIFGGLSASYYHEELIRYPYVDYVVRGDSAEEPLRQLLAAIKEGRRPADVPNLTWKDGGQVHINERAAPPANLDAIVFDYRTMMRSTLRYLDLLGHLPFSEWLRYPITCALSCRGCIHHCVTCGGSAFAHNSISGRQRPAFRSPEMLAQDVALAARHIPAPVIVLGDLLQAGADYAEHFLEALKAAKIRNHLAIEFFAPPPRRILERIAAAIPKFNIQISPESHDEAIRRRFGRLYDNAALEQMLADAHEVGCQRLDLFFMIGLPGQTAQSVRDTLAYCRTLLERFGRNPSGWLHPYISPLAPFLDPGSLAFEHPEQYGYRLFCRTLEEHRRALLAPTWQDTLNYETEWLSRREIAQMTYEAAFELNRLKTEYGLQQQKIGRRLEQRIATERAVLAKIEEILATAAEADREARIAEVLRQFKLVGAATLCHAHEMKWPVSFLRFNPFRILQGLWARPPKQTGPVSENRSGRHR